MSTTIQDNVAIANAIGLRCVEVKDVDGKVMSQRWRWEVYFYRADELKFDKRWDWTIRAVEWINSIHTPEEEFAYAFVIHPNECYITDNNTESDTYGERLIENPHGATMKEMVYITIVEFIKWYNEQK